jgi:quercetin dioxygenase-like cupin family protein
MHQLAGRRIPACLKRCLATSTLGGRDGSKIGRGNRRSNVFRRYHQNAYDNVSANCGARRQRTAASIVFRDFAIPGKIQAYDFGQLGCWPHLGLLFIPHVWPNHRHVLLAHVMIRQPLPVTHEPSQSDSSTHAAAAAGCGFGRARISAAWLDAATTPIAASSNNARSIVRSRANQQTIDGRYRLRDSLRSFPARCSQLLVDGPSRRVAFRAEPGMLANRCLAGKDDHAFTHVLPVHRVERHLDAHVRAAAGEGEQEEPVGAAHPRRERQGIAAKGSRSQGIAMASDSNRDLTQLSPLWREAGAGPTLDVLGVPHVYKAMADETGQQFSIWESIVPPGAGAPAHTHTREDEAFYVLNGELLFELEGASDPLRLGAGGFLFAPRNRRHGYRNAGTVAAHLLVFAIPGAGLDRMFAAFDAAGKRTAHMPSIDTIAAIAEQYGVVIHPPAG